MADVRPFRALRPRNDVAKEVIAPPYDVLTDAQARALAENRSCFVRITRSEVDLPMGTDAHSDVAYQKARENLDLFRSSGLMQVDQDATYYFYGQVMGDHHQVGILAATSVAEYDKGLIAKHEFTRPDKEDDRTHHMDVLDAQVGLVFLTYRPTPAIAALTKQVTSAEPAWEVTTEDDVIHRLWPAPTDVVDDIAAAFKEVPKLYIADGHHRSAAASRIFAKRKSAPTEHFLAGLFPSDSLQIMAYNRLIHDLNGHDADGFLAQIDAKWNREQTTVDTPEKPGDVHMYFQNSWFKLTLKDAFASDDVVKSLDASALQDNLLAPVLGIEDPRRSKRVTFLGGIHGSAGLVKGVEEGAAVAFALYPVQAEQLFAVADADRVMPPKSTWFEPKLREGVVVRPLS